MKYIFTFILACMLGTSFLLAQVTLHQTLEHDGLQREYIIYIPVAYDASLDAVPLLFNFHGYTQTAANMMVYGDLRPVADTANFILVYPQGSPLNGIPHWNVGSWTQESTADDIGFTEAMIDTLLDNFNIDSTRIYACGYSNGGFFSFELACQLSEKIAAIGAVAASMSEATHDACAPLHPTPVVTIHGTLDVVVRYDGISPPGILAQPDALAYWTAFNHTASEPTIVDLPDISTSDNSTVQHYTYAHGDSCSSVEHYLVNRGGHDWCGASGNMDIHASKVIWDFVSQYNIKGNTNCDSISALHPIALENEITISPNPSSGSIHITTKNDRAQRYEIYSTTGTLMQSGTLNQQNAVVDVTQLPNGIYLLKINQKWFRLVKLN